MSNDNELARQPAPVKASSTKWLPLAIIAVLVVGGLYLRSRKSASGSAAGGAAGQAAAEKVQIATVKTIPVSTGTLTVTLPITGSLKSNQNVELSSKITGRVAHVYVEDGSAVKRGQLLVALDDADLRAQVQAARAQVSSAQVRYKQTVIGVPARVQEVSTAIAEAQATLRTAQARYKQALLNEPVQFQNAQGQVANAHATVATATARLKQARDTGKQTTSEVDADIKRALSVVTAANAAVAAAQANASQQQAALAEVKRGAREQQIAQAQAQVNIAQATLHNAETELNRQKILVQGGAAAQSAQDQAQTAYDVAKAQLESAQQNLSLVKEGATTEEVRQAEERLRAAQEAVQQSRAQVVQAEAGLATAQSGRGRELVAQGEITTAVAALTQAQEGLLTANANLAQIPITRQETRVAKQTVDQAQAALLQANANRSQIPVAHADVLAAAASVQTAQAAQQQAQVNLDYARIYSPVNGVVNAKTTDVGETAAPGNSLLSLVSLDRVYFEAQVSENNVRDVHTGQIAQITVPAVSAQAFAGYVSDVIPTADPKSRQFRVRVTIPNAPRQLTPGAFARGVLTTQQVRNALTVPTDAVHNEDGTSVLLLATGSGEEARVKRLVVRVGAEAEDKVQIMGGVRVGDPVIMTTQSLHDGDRIKIVQSG